MKIEHITWLDSSHVSGWHDPANADYEVMTCHSFGVVISEDKHQVSIAGSYEDIDQVSCVMIIPKSTIVCRATLRDSGATST
jgi:hypothetical protein